MYVITICLFHTMYRINNTPEKTIVEMRITIVVATLSNGDVVIHLFIHETATKYVGYEIFSFVCCVWHKLIAPLFHSTRSNVYRNANFNVFYT